MIGTVHRQVVPGRVTDVWTTASAWRGAAARIEGLGALVRAVAAGPCWSGLAADAFQRRAGLIRGGLWEWSDAVSAGARALEQFAAVLAETRRCASSACADEDRARATLARDPHDGRALAGLAAALDAQRDAYDTAEQAAESAAQALDRLADSLTASDHWWDPFGWFDKKSDDPTVPDVGVNPDMLDETWDPSQIRQGAFMGDCYLVATLMSYMRTDAGDALMRRNVVWNAKTGAFDVTLYIDGKPTVYPVRDVYQQGATNDSHFLWWSTGPDYDVVSIYEAAVAQAIGYKDLDDGGDPGWVMQAVAGHTCNTFSSDLATASIKDALDGGAVVAITTSISSTFPETRVEGTDGTVTTRSVKIEGNHVYSVERADADGSVWVRDPWGPNNGDDGGTLIRLSHKQFESAFDTVDVQQVH